MRPGGFSEPPADSPYAIPGGTPNDPHRRAPHTPPGLALAHRASPGGHANPLPASHTVRCAPGLANGRNHSPDNAPDGPRSHAPIDRPRAGKALRYVASSSSTRRRAVVDSPTTSSRLTSLHGQPRSRAISGASRSFRSVAWIVACESGTTDLTSVIRIVAVGRCSAKTSIDPRSPRMAYDASTIVSQPTSWNRLTTSSTSPAWAASSSRSRPSPCQRMPTSIDALKPSTIRRTVPSCTSSIRPDSSFEISCLETPTASAKSCWRQRRRIRSARHARPMRIESIRSG